MVKTNKTKTQLAKLIQKKNDLVGEAGTEKELMALENKIIAKRLELAKETSKAQTKLSAATTQYKEAVAKVVDLELKLKISKLKKEELNWSRRVQQYATKGGMALKRAETGLLRTQERIREHQSKRVV